MLTVFTEEEIRRICNESISISDFCRKCGWQPHGANYRTFYKYKERFNLDTSHFTGQRTNIGGIHNKQVPLDELFSLRYVDVSNSKLIKSILDNNLKPYVCEDCGIVEWNGKPIKLQLHHKDGNHFNNSLDNLQFLCPNCHSLTDTYCGKKNKGCNHTTLRIPKHTCKVCGKPLHREPKTGMCIECLRKSYKNKSASKETLNVEEG